MTLRTCNFCKVLGGILMVLGLPRAILVLLQVRVLGMAPDPMHTALLPAALGVYGTILFIIFDRRAKAIKKASGDKDAPAGADWKGMLIFGLCLVAAIAAFAVFGMVSDHLGR